MKTQKYILTILIEWYAELGLLKKLAYPLIALILYFISVLILVGLYWLKTDLGYNMIRQGGWHAFAHCVMVQLPLER